VSATDNTNPNLPPGKGETAALVRSMDWGRTPLGPIETWPQNLRVAAGIVLDSRFPKVLLWGPQFIQLYNDGYLSILGSKHPEAMGQPSASCWPEAWSFNKPILEKVLQEGETIYLEDQEYVLYPRGERKLFYLTLCFSPVRGPSGTPAGVLCTLIDTTKRVLAERENERLLAQSRDTSRTLEQWFEQAPGFVALLRGPKHVFELANRAFYQLVGHREILGKPAFDALPDVQAQGFEELLDRVYVTGEPFVGRGVKMMVQREPGAQLKPTYVDLIYQPVFDPDGSVSGIFAQGHDITEQQRLMDALQQADRRKDEFLATLAHELRNPLAPIRQAALISRSPQASERQLRWSQRVIDRQVQHMSWLLDDLLDLSRISLGRLELRIETVDLASVVEAAAETAAPLIEAREHLFSIELPEAPLLLSADPLRLAQILSNLLTNAAKYTNRRGRIELSASATDEEVVIQVRDNGIGIAPEWRTRIFDMFSRVESVHDRVEGGLGIGLALTRGLAELHWGTLEADSAGLGLGSVFTVRLPHRLKQRTHPETESPPVPEAAIRGRRILVADDNVDAAQSLALLLEFDGHEVRVAHDGLEALKLAESFRPDAAVLDIGMPGLNGHQLAERIRQAPWGKGMALIALTGWGQSSDQQRALAAGFDHHCTKPIDPAALRPWLQGSAVHHPDEAAS
jgi:PAS domain S-box-containing protein